MAVTRLSLGNFRSYTDALVAPGCAMVVLTGENGAGKTNVLEAVSLLSPGRGLRGATLSDMARSDGPGGFSVAARLLPPLPLAGGCWGGSEGSSGGRTAAPTGEGLSSTLGADDTPTLSPSREREGSVDIGTGATAAAPERRQVRINGAPASATSLAEWLSILWLTPAMDRIFLEGASGRRRFLDRLVLALSPGHASHAARYEAAMRARNKLLAEDAPDPAWLSALEARMADHGRLMVEARETAIAALQQGLAAAPDGPFARPTLRLEGGNEDLASDLARSRARDAAAGRTLIGPHRTDLVVTHAAKNQPAERCSTGEQKALLLAIVLAHADLVADRTGRRPILLLDEVAAHLDPTRRAALFQRLGEGGGQVWMTGTEPSLFEAAGDASRFTVQGGRVEPA